MTISDHEVKDTNTFSQGSDLSSIMMKVGIDFAFELIEGRQRYHQCRVEMVENNIVAFELTPGQTQGSKFHIGEFHYNDFLLLAKGQDLQVWGQSKSRATSIPFHSDHQKHYWCILSEMMNKTMETKQKNEYYSKVLH